MIKKNTKNPKHLNTQQRWPTAEIPLIPYPKGRPDSIWGNRLGHCRFFDFASRCSWDFWHFFGMEKTLWLKRDGWQSESPQIEVWKARTGRCIFCFEEFLRELEIKNHPGFFWFHCEIFWGHDICKDVLLCQRINIGIVILWGSPISAPLKNLCILGEKSFQDLKINHLRFSRWANLENSENREDAVRTLPKWRRWKIFLVELWDHEWGLYTECLQGSLEFTFACRDP